MLCLHSAKCSIMSRKRGWSSCSEIWMNLHTFIWTKRLLYVYFTLFIFFNYSFNIRSNFIFYISYGQDLLMTNSLFHNDVRVYFTESYLGIKLDVVDHVRAKFCSWSIYPLPCNNFQTFISCCIGCRFTVPWLFIRSLYTIS